MGLQDVTCLLIYLTNPVPRDYLDPTIRLGSELYGPHGAKTSPQIESHEHR